VETIRKPIIRPVYSVVPCRPAIELIAYDPQFADYYRECGLQTKRWLVEHVEPAWTVFDVGAGAGCYTILASQLAPCGQIYALEVSHTLSRLCENLDHNRCTNVTPIPYDVGEAAQSPTIDQIIAEHGVTRLDCLRVDAGSSTLEILKGAEGTLRRLRPWVVIHLSAHPGLQRLASPLQAAAPAQILEWLYTVGHRRALITDYETYILRVDDPPEKLHYPDTAGIHIAFDTRPLCIPSGFDKGRSLDHIFEAHPILHNDASITKHEGDRRTMLVSVTAPGPRWSYAAAWMRTDVPVGGPLVVEADLRVQGGAIGVGCLTQDGSTYVGEEAQAHPAAHVQTLKLAVENGSAVGSFMLRNADPQGATAIVEVYEIRAYLAVPAAGRAPSGLASPAKRRISIEECAAALKGHEPSSHSSPSTLAGIDIVPVEELGLALGFRTAFVPEVRVYRRWLPNFRSETDEAAVFAYIYREFRPRRHFEFGTWEGWGAVLCASACDAEIWTVNLAEGERDENGNPVYTGSVADPSMLPAALRARLQQPGVVCTDAGPFIGWRYRAAGFSSRVHQLLCDTRDLDVASLGRESFDSALIDGGHSIDVVTNDTIKALELVRPGGLVIWHDFCPDVETLRRNEAPRGVVSAIIEGYHRWKPALSKWFWIRPSWILIGVKNSS